MRVFDYQSADNRGILIHALGMHPFLVDQWFCINDELQKPIRFYHLVDMAFFQWARSPFVYFHYRSH